MDIIRPFTVGGELPAVHLEPHYQPEPITVLFRISVFSVNDQRVVSA